MYAGDVVLRADLPQHPQHLLVRAAVQRAVQRGHGGGQRASTGRRASEPTARIVMAEQFCSWSACRMNSTSSARSRTGFGSYVSSVVFHIMFRKLPA